MSVVMEEQYRVGSHRGYPEGCLRSQNTGDNNGLAPKLCLLLMQAVTVLFLSRSPSDVYLLNGDQIKVAPKNTAFPNTREDECLALLVTKIPVEMVLDCYCLCG